MGNSASNLPQNSANNFIWDPVRDRHYISYDDIINPKFYTENTLSLFSSFNQEENFFPFSKPKNHKTEDLSQLMLGCYEELNNIPQIIETIIEGDIEPEDDIIKYLCYCFYSSIQTAESSCALHTFNYEFSKKFFSPFGITSLAPIQGFEQPTFSILLTSLSTSFSLLEDPKFPSQSILPFIEFLNGSVTTVTITPPTPEFLPEGPNPLKDLTFTAGYVNPHGACSNGKFLFVLCGNNTIQIFPLLNGGTMPSTITVYLNNLNVQIPQEANINASDSKVQIIYLENQVCMMITLDIQSLVQNNLSQQVRPLFNSQFKCDCSCSDGITQVIIQPDHTYIVIDLIEKKQVYASRFDENKSRLPYDLSTVVVETNGNFISFIIQNQENQNNNNNNNNNFSIYRTYSMNGSFLREEKFQTNERIIASCIDSINKCHWTVISAGNSRFFVRRYAFCGGENSRIFGIEKYSYPIMPNPSPFAFFSLIISSLHRHLRGMINSHISPSMFLAQQAEEFFKLIDILEKVINYPEDKIHLLKESQKPAKECLTILISLNLKRIACTSEPTELITTKIFKLIRLLPTNLASILFFSNFDYLMFNHSDEAILMMIGLLKSISSSHLILFALRMIEESKSIATISFKTSNGLFDMIPQDCRPASSLTPTLFIFILLHQRCLVREAQKFLKNDPLAVIDFSKYQADSRTVLDLLGDYIQSLFSIFENTLSINEPNEIAQSAIYIYFANFLRLLSSLAEFHSVAQVATAILSMIIKQLPKLMSVEPKTVLNVVFIFGKFASTLLKGGLMSDLETKFLPLIRANVNLIDQPDLINNLDSEEIENFKDERINFFLNSEGNSIDEIYKKIKPLVNKNLNYKIREIDRLALVSFSKHLDCLEEMLFFDGTKQPSTKLRSAFDQMLLVRNEFRRCLQNNKDTSVLRTKCLMLLRMESDQQLLPKSLGEFVVMKIEPSYFKKIIIGQRKRIQTTLVGFALLDQTYGHNVNPLVHRIIGYNLAMIETFEGLSSIMRISKLSEAQEKQILTFFQRVIEAATTEKTMLLIIVAYRFFRDLDSLKAVQNSILLSVLSAYDAMPTSYSLFALALSLMKGITEIPEQLLRIDQNKNLFRWLLLSEATKYILPPEEFVSSFIQNFWYFKPEEMRLVLRVMYNIQEMITDPHTIFSSFIQFIGDQIKAFRNLAISSEIILFLRQILVNDNAPLKKTLTMYILSANLQNATESFMLGIFCILGLTIEDIRPYATVNFHPNRHEMFQFYAIPTSNGLMFYPKPFHLFSDTIKALPMKQSDIYAVPRIEIQPEQFPYYDFIMSFHIPLSQLYFTTSVTYAIYMQLFASYCRNQTFVSKISPDSLLKLYENPISFHNIQDSIRSISNIISLGVHPEISGFNVLTYNGVAYKSFLSHVLLGNAPVFDFVVTIPAGKNSAPSFVGIVSDNLEPYYTRYTLISFPDGKKFPICDDTDVIRFNAKIRMIKVTVVMQKRQFWIENKCFQFPIGAQFRFIFATSIPNYNEVRIAVVNNIPVFNMNAPPLIQAFNQADSPELYPIPRWAYDFTRNLPSNISSLPTLKRIIAPFSEADKVQHIFIPPPLSVIIHGGFSSSASPSILQSLYSGMFLKLALQYSTIALMRIINFDVNFAKPIVFKMFRYFILTVESFSVPLSQQGFFPYDMSQPIWKRDVDPIYFSLENEVKKALMMIVSDASNIKTIATEIWKLSNSKKLHSLMFPHPSLIYFPIAPPSVNMPRDQMKIIFNNDFEGPTLVDATIQGTNVQLPIIYRGKPVAVLINFPKRPRSLGILAVNPMSNEWLINTPIELLLLLKNFVFIAPQEHRPMIKSIILDMFLIRSPVVACYLNHFSDFVQMQIPSTPLDQNPEYLARLALVGSFLKTVRDPNFINTYQREQQLMTNKTAADLACHFPEFFSSPLPPPKSQKCQIPAVTINPGALQVDFTSYILTFRLFSKSYESICGFPFWEIIPYWIRISGVASKKESSNQNADEERRNPRRKATDYEIVAPKVLPVSNEVMKVSNPSIPNLRVFLKKKASATQRVPSDSILMYASSELFEDANYVQFNNFSEPIVVPIGDTYFSLNLFQDRVSPWEIFFLQVDYSGSSSRPPSQRAMAPPNQGNQNARQGSRPRPTNAGGNNNNAQAFDYSRMTVIDPDQIRAQFIIDMKQFAVEWKESDTNELLNQIPQLAFLNDRFDDIEHIARTSTLTTRFTPTVVVLRALILHQFNYIHARYKDEVPEGIWHHFSSFMSIDVASQSLLNSFATTHFQRGQGPIFEINRRKAREMIANGKGDPRDSIIAQLAKFVSKYGAAKFRAKEKPWTVSFKGELGIDAGGPARELLVEVSTSIFEPTTQLMVQVDASARGESRFFYVPNEKALGKNGDFYAIGVVVGIIIRTGLLQELPFAPIVWKSLAGEPISDEDVLDSDRLFRESFREINNNIQVLSRLNNNNSSGGGGGGENVEVTINKTWTVECWNGTTVGLPNRNSQAFVEPQQLMQYMRECIMFRKKSIRPMLESMRKGFVDNVDVKTHYLMKGTLLSRLAQGSGKVTIEQMKAITEVSGFPDGKNNEYIRRFWRAASRFNDEEMRLLFKFITTLTRMPSAARMSKQFKITIDPMNCPSPDIMMPTASTCFNKLHLPPYSNDDVAYTKILYAVKFCSTMENK